MKRSEWEKERKRLEDTKQREIDLINDLRYKVKDLPEECEERENIAKPFLYRSGGLPLNIELAIFPHRVKKREQEALREKRIKEEAEKEVLEIIREERRKESVSFWFVVVVVVLFFVWRCA